MGNSKREENMDTALIQQVNAENKYSKGNTIKVSTNYSENEIVNKAPSVKFKTILKIILGLFVILFVVVLVIAGVRYIMG